MKTILQYFVIACVLGTFASVASAQKVGSTSMQFLHVMPCARATAMGEAYSVLASGADAVFWNPAGLVGVQNQEISSTYIDWIFDARQGALGYAASLGSVGAIGAQIQYVDFGEFEETTLASPYIKSIDEPGMTGRTFHPFSYLVGLTYAKSLTDRFSTGLSIKYGHESLYDGGTISTRITTATGTSLQQVNTWGSGMLFDFGIHYFTGFRTIRIAASVQNFGADIKYAVESNPAPLLFRFGFAADLVGKDALITPREDSRLTVAFDLFQPNDYTQQAHAGVEYMYQDVFALRAGYKLNYDEEGFTFGGGITQPVGSVKLSLDYSFGSAGTYLGNVQRISLGAVIQ
jgi:hypothetical protein